MYFWACIYLIFKTILQISTVYKVKYVSLVGKDLRSHRGNANIILKKKSNKWWDRKSATKVKTHK